MASVTHHKLNTGATIPAVGFGTWQDKDSQEEAVAEALKAGYRHIDTVRVVIAEVYSFFTQKYANPRLSRLEYTALNQLAELPSKLLAFLDPNSSLPRNYGTTSINQKMLSQLSMLHLKIWDWTMWICT